MGHTTETRARAYQKMKDLRAAWLLENGPCRRCGSWERLEVDHIDPSEKEHHAVWSWSKERREAELKKCQPLCYDCHKKKTYEDFYACLPKHGTNGYHHGCRCDECRAACAKARREYRAAGKDPSRNNYIYPGIRGVWPSPPALEAGDPKSESWIPDQV